MKLENILTGLMITFALTLNLYILWAIVETLSK